MFESDVRCWPSWMSKLDMFHSSSASAANPLRMEQGDPARL
jgi:hypothetical protein